MNVSVVLTTVRPHLVNEALASLPPDAGVLSLEVVVVADFPRPDSLSRALHCNWLERPRLGVVDAVNRAVAHCAGDYIFLFNDQAALEGGALEELALEAALLGRPALLGPRHLPEFDFRYYGLPFLPFPFAHRDTYERLGGVFDPAYGSFYADPDLSMRAHAAGVPVVTVDSAVLRHCNEHDSAHQRNVDAHLAADRDEFRRRWDHLGEFKDP